MNETNTNTIFLLCLQALSEQAKDTTELIHLWVNLGKRMGLDQTFPHLKVVLYEHEDEGEILKTPVGVILAPSEDVVEHLSSEEVFDEMLCIASLNALKRKGVFL
jgi:hypothetical protein